MKSILLFILIALVIQTNILNAQSETIRLNPNLQRIVITLHKSRDDQEKLKLTQELLSKDIEPGSPIDRSFLNSFRSSFECFIQYMSQGYIIERDSVYCSDFAFTVADFNQDGREDIQGTYIFTDNKIRYGIAAGSRLSSYAKMVLNIDSVFARDVNLDGKIEFATVWRTVDGKRYITIHKTFEALLQKSGYFEFGNKGEIYLSPARTPDDTYVLTVDGSYMNEKRLYQILEHRQRAFELFNREDYENAALEFEKSFGIRSSSDTLNYYLALCQMRIGNLGKASYQFQLLAQARHSPFRDSAFYKFLELLPHEAAQYDIKFVDTIPEVFTSMKPQTYLCSADFDGDTKPDLLFGSEGISIYLSSGEILTSVRKNFSPYWVEVTKKRIETVSRMKYTLFHVSLKEDKGDLVLTDTIRMTGLPDAFLSYYGLKSCARFGRKKTDPLIIVDDGPGPSKPNKTFLVSAPAGDILAEIDMDMKASGFALSSGSKAFYIGSSCGPSDMIKDTLPCVVRFVVSNGTVQRDTVFVYPKEPIPPGHNWYGAGYTRIIETDLENDGKLELILQEADWEEDGHAYILRIITHNTHYWREMWNGSFNFGIRTLTADIDGDGVREIFTDDNTGYCKDNVPHIMVIRKNKDLWIQEKLLFPNCYLLDSGDFDNDGSEEVMIMRGPSWQEKSYSLWLIDRRSR